MHHYPHHISDFNNSTRHLTRIERSVYRDLIDLYYDTEAPINVDIKYICRRIIAITEIELTAVEQVLSEFFVLTDNGYEHNRCNIEIEKYKNNSSNKSKAGIASAKARKLMKVKLKKESTGVQQVFNRESTAVANQEPRTKSQEPLNISKRFTEFWDELPKKIGKKDCEKIWKRRKLDTIADKIIDDVRNRKLYDRSWLDGFIPNPKTYLNGDRWDDEIQKNEAIKSGANNKKLSGCELLRESKRQGDEWLAEQGLASESQIENGDALEGTFHSVR